MGAAVKIFHHMDDTFAHNIPFTISPRLPLCDMIQVEDSSVIIPSQPSASMHSLPCLAPHAGLFVQHTDDEASVKTQYFCH